MNSGVNGVERRHQNNYQHHPHYAECINIHKPFQDIPTNRQRSPRTLSLINSSIKWIVDEVTAEILRHIARGKSRQLSVNDECLYELDRKHGVTCRRAENSVVGVVRGRKFCSSSELIARLGTLIANSSGNRRKLEKALAKSAHQYRNNVVVLVVSSSSLS
uniref:Uncharacterized protein n=1 Tax=Vespula pensylvanica TaxID=30213 RepID=A0A834P874_VESPE|nr:hypothetical protein H0235_004813 [Vespula pensylvanica]